MFHFFSGILILLTLVNIGTWLTLTEHVNFNLAYSIVLVVGILSHVFYHRMKFKHLYESNWFKNFSGVIVTFVLLGFIFGFANYLAFKNVKTMDLSGRHIHSLPPEMKDLLSKIPHPLKLTVISPSHSFNAFRGYMNQLKAEKSDMEFEYLQPHLRPDLLKQFQIESEQSIIVEYQGRKDVLTSFGHIDFARSFKRLMKGKRIKVAFTNNHNESSLDSKEQSGLLKFSQFLERADVELKQVNLASGQMDLSFETLVIWGPRVDFRQKELERLDEFLKSGKNLIIALDPSLREDNVPLLRKWMQNYGVSIINSYVIDKYQFVNGSKGTVPMVNQQWGGKEQFQFKLPVFFPLASHIEAVNFARPDLKEKVSIEPLLVTTEAPHSWAEMNHEEMLNQAYRFNKEEDRKGPVTLSALVKIENQGSMLLFGNSKFIENNYAKFINNFDMILKGLEQFSFSKESLKLSMPMVKEEPLFINGIQVKLVFYLTIIVFPLLGVFSAYFSYRLRLK